MNDLLKIGVIGDAAYAVAQPTQKNALLTIAAGALLGFGAVQFAKSQDVNLRLDFKGTVEQPASQFPEYGFPQKQIR